MSNAMLSLVLLAFFSLVNGNAPVTYLYVDSVKGNDTRNCGLNVAKPCHSLGYGLQLSFLQNASTLSVEIAPGLYEGDLNKNIVLGKGHSSMTIGCQTELACVFDLSGTGTLFVVQDSVRIHGLEIKNSVTALEMTSQLTSIDVVEVTQTIISVCSASCITGTNNENILKLVSVTVEKSKQHGLWWKSANGYLISDSSGFMKHKGSGVFLVGVESLNVKDSSFASNGQHGLWLQGTKNAILHNGHFIENSNYGVGFLYTEVSFFNGSVLGNGAGFSLFQSDFEFASVDLRGNKQHSLVNSSSGRVTNSFVVSNGGGLRLWQSNTSLFDVHLSDNTCSQPDGCALDVLGGQLTLLSSVVSNNHGLTAGGVAAKEGAVVFLNSSSVSGNVANSAGGLFCDATFFCFSCSVSNNTATNSSGLHFENNVYCSPNCQLNGPEDFVGLCKTTGQVVVVIALATFGALLIIVAISSASYIIYKRHRRREYNIV